MDMPGRLYLATTNTEVRKLVTTSIPVDTLRLLIENSLCRKVMLILDCCYAGAVGRSFIKGSIDEKLQELARGNGVYILTASTASQTAQEREGDEYGLLTKHIISGIKQGAADANNDGIVSMDDLYQYIYINVKSEGYQEPMRWALNVKGEELVIARASGVWIRDQLTKKLIEIRESLPSLIFRKALEVVEDRHAPLYDLVFKLYREQLTIGRFIEEWNSAEKQRELEENREAARKAEEQHNRGLEEQRLKEAQLAERQRKLEEEERRRRELEAKRQRDLEAHRLTRAVRQTVPNAPAPDIIGVQTPKADNPPKVDIAPSDKVHNRRRSFVLAGAISLILLAVALYVVIYVVNKKYTRQIADIGFSPERVLTLQLPSPPTKNFTAESRRAFYTEIIRQVNAVPGIEEAAVVTSLPLMDNDSTINVVVEGHPADNNGRRININYQNVSPGYFPALGIPIIQGRSFFEDSKSPRVVIINQTLARLLFQDESPIGKRLNFITGERDKEIWRTIVGVVGDVKNVRFDRPPAAEIYECYLQHTQPNMFLVTRTTEDPLKLANAVSSKIQSIDKDQPITNVKTMDQIVDDAKSK
jgi:hypothetical protein